MSIFKLAFRVLANGFNILTYLIRCIGLVSLLATVLGFSASATPAEEYVLAPGDQVRIDVLERDQINGSYRVEADGTVSVPGIGVLTAAGQDLRSFEATLRQLASQTIVEPSISVQMAVHRPVFVLGDVKEPGMYDYVQGLNALQAVAAAGGFHRKVDGDALSRSMIVNQTRKSLDSAEKDYAEARINLARLRAERAMLDEVVFDEGDAHDPRLADVRARASDLFQSRQEGFKDQLAKLQATVDARGHEIAAFDRQLMLQEEVLASRRAQLEEALANRERGLVTDSRVESIERDEQNARAQQLQIVTLKRQAQTNLAELEREMSTLVANREVDIDQSIQSFQSTMSRSIARIREDLALLEEIGAERSADVGDGPSFRLELRRGAALIGMDVDLSESIAPGDTLFVVRVRNRSDAGH